jgi:hypothetical protein
VVDVVVDDQHEPAPVWYFSTQDASVTGSATPRGTLHHPLFGDPLTAHNAEIGVPGTPAPRSKQRRRRRRDSHTDDNP